jgi:hypothetical protein
MLRWAVSTMNSMAGANIANGDADAAAIEDGCVF